MQRKSETFGKLEEFRAIVESQLGKTIKTFRSDRRGEFMGIEFNDHMLEHETVSEQPVPINSQQNGVAECRN